ncbi:MAG: hypothetical protein ACOX2K_06365 [Bacillota bacterium]|jgi:hypothetical protein
MLFASVFVSNRNAAANAGAKWRFDQNAGIMASLDGKEYSLMQKVYEVN